MTVKYYEWGVFKGGSGGDPGGVAPASANYGPVATYDGTLGAAVTTVTFSTSAKRIHLMNTHDSRTLQYSLDGGTDWFDLGPYAEVSEWAYVSSIQLRATGGATTYALTVTLTG